jgi:hypothetical protein
MFIVTFVLGGILLVGILVVASVIVGSQYDDLHPEREEGTDEDV